MTDLSCVYTLTTGGGTLRFNDGVLGQGSRDNLYWISTVHGLDGPTIRAPFDDKPFGDGGLLHKFWKGPRHPIFEGSLIVQEVGWGNSQCQSILNEMEVVFNAVLDSILQTNGTLTWTPAGQSAKSLAVRYEVALDIQPTTDYYLRTFNFGLVSAAADPT